MQYFTAVLFDHRRGKRVNHCAAECLASNFHQAENFGTSLAEKFSLKVEVEVRLGRLDTHRDLHGE